MPDLGQGPPLFTPPGVSASNSVDRWDALADMEVASTLMVLSEGTATAESE